MKEAERQTRSYLMELFRQHGFHPRTDRGQNFLIDLNIVDYIVDHARLGRHDVVLEVGAGTGGLTAAMAVKAAAVVAVEVDTNMYRLASRAVDSCGNVTLLCCDVLKNKNRFSPQVIEILQEKLQDCGLQIADCGLQEAQDEARLHDPQSAIRNPQSAESRRRLKLISNLPYNIATPVVANLVATELAWSRMVVTIQWELAQRMTAKPGSSHYGSLAVWLQSQCHVRILKRLRPTVFWPRPKVSSAIVQLVPNHEGRQVIGDRSFFHDFLRRLFHQRRKFLRSVLVGMYRKQLDKPEIDDILETMQLTEGLRAEQMDIPILVTLSNRLDHAIHETAGTVARTHR